MFSQNKDTQQQQHSPPPKKNKLKNKLQTNIARSLGKHRKQLSTTLATCYLCSSNLATASVWLLFVCQ